MSETTVKRSPIFGRISLFTKAEDATTEVNQRSELLKGIGKKSLYRVYEVPVPHATDEHQVYYAVDLNPQSAIGQVASSVGWVANPVGSGRQATVTPQTVAVQAANWTAEQLKEAAKQFAKLAKDAAS